MTIAQELDTLRGTVPGCRTVAFADLSSGLVLCVSSARRERQEDLDALCVRASELLDGPAAAAAADPEPPDSAVDLSPDRTAAFLRSPADPVEVLCCVGSTGMDVGQLLEAARAALVRMDTRG